MSFYIIENENKLELGLKLNEYFKTLYNEYVGVGLNTGEFKYIELSIPDFFEYYDKEANVLTGFTYNNDLYHNGTKVNNLPSLIKILTNEEYEPVNFIDLFLSYIIECQNIMYDNTVDIIQTSNIHTVDTIKSMVPIFEDVNNKITKLNNKVSYWKIISTISIILSIISRFF